MQPKQPGIAIPPMPCSDFIEYILKRHRAPTTLVICSTREAFLKDLLSSLHNDHSLSPSENNEDITAQHFLLIPTIHLIAKSSSVHLALVPTLPHLRSYLAAYSPASDWAFSESISTNSSYQAPLLAIWGLAHIHRSTADYSAQGLSRTIASAVVAADHGNQKLVLAEPQVFPETSEYANADASEVTLEDSWKDQVPLLSGSIRYGGEERTSTGNTIEIGRVAARWCRFVRLDQTMDVA